MDAPPGRRPRRTRRRGRARQGRLPARDRRPAALGAGRGRARPRRDRGARGRSDEEDDRTSTASTEARRPSDTRRAVPEPATAQSPVTGNRRCQRAQASWAGERGGDADGRQAERDAGRRGRGAAPPRRRRRGYGGPTAPGRRRRGGAERRTRPRPRPCRPGAPRPASRPSSTGVKCTSRLSRARPESRWVAASLRPSPSATISSTVRPSSARFSAQATSSATATSRS